MTETQIIMWILGAFLAVMFSGAGAYMNLVSRVAEVERKLSERVVKLETTFELLGKNAAKILHSPHTPDLDRLLEKYIDRHYEMTFEEWEALRQMCEQIIKDNSKEKQYRSLAGLLHAVCSHKTLKKPKWPDGLEH